MKKTLSDMISESAFMFLVFTKIRNIISHLIIIIILLYNLYLSKRSIMSTLTNVRPVTWPVVLASPVCGFCLAALATMEADLPEMTGWFDPDILEAQ